MHNNIMAAGSRDRPPMLATGRYAQWRSRFLRLIDIKTSGVICLREKCLLVQWVLYYVSNNWLTSYRTVFMFRMQRLLRNVGSHLMRLQHRGFTQYSRCLDNVFGNWSHHFHLEKTIESYYTRFYKMMNEMIRNNLTVATDASQCAIFLSTTFDQNVQICHNCEAKHHKLDEVPYNKLFVILKHIPKRSLMNSSAEMNGHEC
ncbi:hypothetical protein Tco_0844450 [Tanacetum coccineum]